LTITQGKEKGKRRKKEEQKTGERVGSTNKPKEQRRSGWL
jgi:hypothetical protein